MNSLSISQMEDVTGGGCAAAIASGIDSGAWAGFKAAGRVAPLLAATGVGAGTVLVAGGIIGAIGGGLFGWGAGCEN